MRIVKCSATPLPGFPHSDEVIGGEVIGWANTDDDERAEQMVRDYLAKYGWALDKVESIHNPNMDGVRNDPIHFAHYQKALRQGAAAEISAYKEIAKRRPKP